MVGVEWDNGGVEGVGGGKTIVVHLFLSVHLANYSKVGK